MKYLVIVEKMGANYGAYSPDVAGCVATGATASETLKRMQEALEWHLEDEEVLPKPKGMGYWVEHFDEIAKPNALFVEVSIGQEIVGTEAAFEAMLSERGVSKKLGVERSTVANWKRYLHSGTQLSTDKMAEMLQKAGWQQLNSPSWRVAK